MIFFLPRNIFIPHWHEDYCLEKILGIAFNTKLKSYTNDEKLHNFVMATEHYIHYTPHKVT